MYDATTVRAILRLGRQKELSFLAGSIAFFAFVSIFPTLLLALVAGTLLGGEALAERLVGLLSAYLSEEGVRVLREALTVRTGLVGASVAGVFGLLWSGLKVFRAIDIAFNRVYGVEKLPSLLQQLLHAIVAAISIGTGLLVLITARMILAELHPGGSVSPVLVGYPLLVVGLVIVLAPLYYVMAPVSPPLREIFPGTVVAVVGLLVLREVFHIYSTHAGQYQIYGFIGAVLLFLLWLYFGALVLLFGAVVNVAVAEPP